MPVFGMETVGPIAVTTWRRATLPSRSSRTASSCTTAGTPTSARTNLTATDLAARRRRADHEARSTARLVRHGGKRRRGGHRPSRPGQDPERRSRRSGSSTGSPPSSSAPSARATTTSTSSRTRTGRSGSASTSARAASATGTASGFLTLAQGLAFGERARGGRRWTRVRALPADSELGQSTSPR